MGKELVLIVKRDADFLPALFISDVNRVLVGLAEYHNIIFILMFGNIGFLPLHIP